MMVDSTNRRGASIARMVTCSVAAVTITLAGCTHANTQAVASALNAQNADNLIASGPAIWQLQDEDTTVYLYGYAAALPTETTWRSAAFDEAFEQADLVILETLTPGSENQAEMQAVIQSNGIYQDGRTLSSVLSPEDLEMVASVASSLGVPIQGIDRLKPWLASIQLEVVAATIQDLDLANTPSAAIQAQARGANKTVDAFEEPTELLLKIASLDESEHIGMLTHAALDLRDSPDRATLLNDAWLNGDVMQIGDILHGPNGSWSSDVVYDAVLVRRNEEWSVTIANLLAEHEGTVFVAVGLGHLAGNDSLVTVLRRRGHDVKRL